MIDYDLSPEEFYNLTFYEFTLYILRARKKAEKELSEKEELWTMTRIIWSVLMNANFKKKGGGQYEGTDLIKLSFDKPVEERKLTFKEAKQLLGSKWKFNG